MADSDDDIPQLSGTTLAALKDFYSERDVQQKRYEDLRAAVEDPHQELSMNMFSEDWNASQFWYSDETASALARQLLSGASSANSIAVVSAPSVYIQLRNMLGAMDEKGRPMLKLLEFDDRFEVLKEFVHYNFENPLTLPLDLKGKFDRIIVDPPFISEDCQTKAAMTVRWLSKQSAKDDCTLRIVICTGERMSHLIPKIYPGCRTTTFEPKHMESRLSNEFRCYANFECEAWSWLQDEAAV